MSTARHGTQRAATAKGDGRPFVAALAEDVTWTLIGSTPWSKTYQGKAEPAPPSSTEPRSMRMISRHWRGLSKPEQAESYVEHLQTETFPAIRKIPGFVSASILRRRTDGGVEFLIVTRWSSMETIRRFAGADAETAVVPPKVQGMMVEYDLVVGHYEVVA